MPWTGRLAQDGATALDLSKPARTGPDNAEAASVYAVRSPVTPNAACAAASRATGTRYGLQET